MSGPASVERSADISPELARLCAIAERDPRRAVGLARRWYAGAGALPPLARSLTAYALGYALLRWERLDEAEEALSEAYRQLVALEQAQLALHVRRALLYLALLRGGGAGHAADWVALAAAYEQRGDSLAAARARLGELVQLNLQGLASEALDLAAQIGPALERARAPGDQAWLLRLTGVAHVNRASYADAQRCFDEAAARFTQLGQSAELAKTWMECSSLYEHRVDIPRAADYIERAYRVVRRLDLPLRIALCTKNMGWFAALRGEYGHAIQLSLEAYDQLVALKRPDYMAGCDLNLGNIACYSGLWDLALAAYRRAEQVYNGLEYQRMSLLCRRNQAQALRMRGQPGPALELLAEARRAAELFDDRLERAEVQLAQGQALADLGELARAHRELAQAEAIFYELGNQASAGETLLEQGWLLLREGNLAAAEDRLRAAQPLLREQPIYQWRVDYGLGRCAELGGDLPAALGRYRQACEMVARLRQRLANEHASSGLFGQAQHLVDDAIRLAWRADDSAAIVDLAELQRALALASRVREEQTQALARGIHGFTGAHLSPLGAEHGRQRDLQAYLERRLRRRRPLPAAAAELPTGLDLAQLRQEFQRAFPAGWALLLYLRCADQLLCVIITPAGAEVTATPFDAELHELLAQATLPRYRPMTYLFGGVPQEAGAPLWPTLSALGDRLIPPAARARLHPDLHLLIVASGALHGVPWAALRVGQRWLVELATPQLLPGLRIWQDLRGRRRASADALLLGVPEFGDRAADLAGVPAMLDAVAGRWPGDATRLEGAEARADMLLALAGRAELRRYGLIHIATHGQLVATSGLYAHLKLFDADLLYDDICGLGLGGALVVLATCEGAAAEVLPGEEVLSISWAFLAAGARDIIASVWQLYDAAAPLFLDLLYEHLAQGADAPSALARTQRAWLVQQTGDAELDALFGTPLVWGGLSALGAGGAPLATG